MNKFITGQIVLIIFHGSSFANDPVKVHAVVRKDSIVVTFVNNSQDYFFLSDPSHFGLTLMGQNGGRNLGNQSFGKKNTRLILLHPLNPERPCAEAKHDVTFKYDSATLPNFFKGNMKAVVWGFRFGGIVNNKSLFADRFEVELTFSKT